MYKIEFAADDVGQRRYEMAFEACMAQRQPPAVDDWDTVIDLIRKMKKIGMPKSEKTGKLQLFDLDLDGERTVFLEKAEFKMLMSFIKAPVWPSYVVEEARDLMKWLEGHKHEAGTLAKGAPPHKLRQGEKQVAGSIPSKTNADETTGSTGD